MWFAVSHVRLADNEESISVDKQLYYMTEERINSDKLEKGGDFTSLDSCIARYYNDTSGSTFKPECGVRKSVLRIIDYSPKSTAVKTFRDICT